MIRKTITGFFCVLIQAYYLFSNWQHYFTHKYIILHMMDYNISHSNLYGSIVSLCLLFLAYFTLLTGFISKRKFITANFGTSIPPLHLGHELKGITIIK